LLAAADAGVRYIDAQEESGGLRESICSADYAALLERIALKVLGLERRFALSEVPELDTLEVRVDDALIPNRERHGWVYDPGNNWVEFDGYAVPPPGSTVSLSYFPWLGDLNASGDSGARLRRGDPMILTLWALGACTGLGPGSDGTLDPCGGAVGRAHRPHPHRA
jgi:hypothetical protein